MNHTEQTKTQNKMKAPKPVATFLLRRHLIFFSVLLALVGGAVLRSSVATRLDSFTFDEAYHIGAGAAYVQTGDFPLNPEHPPLVKLWTGAFVSDVCQVSPYRAFQDKGDERKYVEEDVYDNNDPDLIQSRSRAAMFALIGNQYLKIGNRAEALRAYRIAKENIPTTDETGELLAPNRARRNRTARTNRAAAESRNRIRRADNETFYISIIFNDFLNSGVRAGGGGNH
jgi:hypothetical protein